jgi:hypothetical protein
LSTVYAAKFVHWLQSNTFDIFNCFQPKRRWFSSFLPFTTCNPSKVIFTLLHLFQTLQSFLNSFLKSIPWTFVSEQTLSFSHYSHSFFLHLSLLFSLTISWWLLFMYTFITTLAVLECQISVFCISDLCKATPPVHLFSFKLCQSSLSASASMVFKAKDQCLNTWVMLDIFFFFQDISSIWTVTFYSVQYSKTLTNTLQLRNPHLSSSIDNTFTPQTLICKMEGSAFHRGCNLYTIKFNNAPQTLKSHGHANLKFLQSKSCQSLAITSTFCWDPLENLFYSLSDESSLACSFETYNIFFMHHLRFQISQ